MATHYNPMSESLRLEVVKRYLNGESVLGISRSIEYSGDTVLRCLKKSGVRIRGAREARIVSIECSPPIYIPTIEVIEKRSAEIRSGWTEDTRLSRTVTKPIEFQTIEMYSSGVRRGVDVSHGD